MNKVFVVAAREFIETVKTRTFMISSVFMPVIMLGFVFGGEWIGRVAEAETQPVRKLAILDNTGLLKDALMTRLATENKQNPTRPLSFEFTNPTAESLESVRQRVTTGDLYGYVAIPQMALDPGNAPKDQPLLCEISARSSQLEVRKSIETVVNDSIVYVRFARHDPPIDRGLVEFLEKPLGFRDVDAATGSDTSGNMMAQFLTPFAFMFLLFMGTMNISTGLLTSLIEEKSTRVIEVLLSAVSPLQLMAGKILGMVTVGGVLILVWSTVGYYTAQMRGMEHLVTFYRLTYVVLYFIPGFLLVAGILAGIGSACNTVKDAQSMAFPISILTIIPMMLWWQISQNPSSLLSVALSYVPPITPFIMILRICADPEIPIVEIVLTQALLWASVVAAIWASAKIFRVGVLMYGKAPTLSELIRWLRYQ